MFGTNQFGSAYFGQGPTGIVVLVLFGEVIIATLACTNPALDLTALTPAYTVTDANQARGMENASAVLVIADGNGARALVFNG